MMSLATGALLVLLLQGCSKSIDARQSTTINGLVYKINDSDPFTGTLTNYPISIAGVLALGSCEIKVKDGLADGLTTCKSTAGVKLSDTNFQAGRKDGTERKWDARTEKLISEVEWKDGQLDGLSQQFNPDSGSTVSKTHWSGNKKDGRQQAWDASGQTLLVDLNWEDGKQTGFSRVDGREQSYKDGLFDGVQRLNLLKSSGGTYYLAYEHSYKDGKLDGVSQDWDEAGHLLSKKVYADGIVQSFLKQAWRGEVQIVKVFAVNPTNDPQASISFSPQNGMVTDGEEQRWGRTGHLYYDVLWDKGKPIKGFLENWNNDTIGSSVAGVTDPDQSADLLKDGVEKQYDDSGNLAYSVTWKSGVPIELWKNQGGVMVKIDPIDPDSREVRQHTFLVQGIQF
jgi:antitoxin component YwqK of YwqJK toxin-antitoxin module